MSEGNDAIDLTLKTLENLKTFENFRKRGDKFFTISNLINSCLGLIVYPNAYLNKRIEKVPEDKITTNNSRYGNIRVIDYKINSRTERLKCIRQHVANALTKGNIILLGKGNTINAIRLYDYTNDELTFDMAITSYQLKQLAVDIANLFMTQDQ